MWLAASHPDYAAEQEAFIVRQLEGPEARARILRQMANGLAFQIKRANDLIVRMEYGDAEAVHEAIRFHGLWDSATELPKADGPGTRQSVEQFIRFADHAGAGDVVAAGRELLGLHERVQEAARFSVEVWQQLLRTKKPSERLQWRRQLERIGTAMVADMRGRRAKGAGVTSFQLAWGYWAEVFRWEQVRAFLFHAHGAPADKIAAVIEAFGLGDLIGDAAGFEREDVVRFCGLTGKGILVAPVSVPDVARTVTARRHGITAQRVANAVSVHKPR